MTVKCFQWKPAEDEILRQFWPIIPEIMSRTGRTYDGVTGRAARLGLFLPPRNRKPNPKVEEAVQRDWHVKHPNQIARELGVHSGSVYLAAKPLGLGKRQSAYLKTYSDRLPYPSKPRGYSKAELAWARENAHRSLEAGLILVHHADAA